MPSAHAQHGRDDQLNGAYRGQWPPGPATDLGSELPGEQLGGEPVGHGPQRLVIDTLTAEHGRPHTQAR